MHTNQNSACSNKEEFHYYESQRFYTKLERDAIHQIGWGLTSSLFYFLVTLRTKKLTAFPSKKFLLEYLQAKSHHTLNKYLDELKELGLIRISTLKVIGEDGRARVRWLYSFPLAVDAGWIEFRDEKDQGPSFTPDFRERRAKFALVESGGDLRINNNIPVQSFPQSPNLETMPESPSAVFLDEETQEETTEISNEVSIDCQESLPVLFTEEIPEEESQKQETEPLVLIEDREKPENEIREELAQCVENFQQKSPSYLAKTLKDDVVCLKKEFGIRNTFTAVKCLLDTKVLVLNPGGWLRSYLANPSWLKRFMEKADQRVLAEERRVKAVIRKQQITEKQDREEERLFEERRRIEEVLRSLPVEEMRKLEEEAKKSLSQNRGVQHGLFLKAQIRNLVVEKYLRR